MEHLQGLYKLRALRGGLIRRDVRSTVGNGRDLACEVDLWGIPLRLVLEVDLIPLELGLSFS